MKVTSSRFSALSDQQLEARLQALVRQERGATTEVLAHLGEIDARRLCGGRAEGTLFRYCVLVLGFSEDEACKRIRAARAARQYPLVYDMVAKNELGLTAISRVAPYLTHENHRELLQAVKQKTIRELEKVLATWFPKPDAPTLIRKLPAPAPVSAGVAGTTAIAAGTTTATTAASTSAATGAAVTAGASATSVGATTAAGAQSAAGASRAFSSVLTSQPSIAAAPAGFETPAPGETVGVPATQCAPSSSQLPTVAGSAGSSGWLQLARQAAPFVTVRRGERGSVAPLSPDRYRVQLTVSEATRDKILRAQALMRHRQPDGDLAVVIDRAVSLLVDELERQQFGKLKQRGHAPAVGRRSRKRGEVDAAVGHATRQPGRRPASQHPATKTVRVERATDVLSGRHTTGGTPAPAPEVVSRRVTAATSQPRAREVVSRRMTAAADPVRAGVAPAGRSGTRAAPPRARARSGGRAVRRAVFERDGGRCTYVGPDGRRCGETAFLQFHHLFNHAWGGEPTVENLTLRCFAHNAQAAVRDFGEKAIRRWRDRSGE